jgi:hypothetical protein
MVPAVYTPPYTTNLVSPPIYSYPPAPQVAPINAPNVGTACLAPLAPNQNHFAPNVPASVLNSNPFSTYPSNPFLLDTCATQPMEPSSTGAIQGKNADGASRPVAEARVLGRELSVPMMTIPHSGLLHLRLRCLFYPRPPRPPPAAAVTEPTHTPAVTYLQ